MIHSAAKCRNARTKTATKGKRGNNNPTVRTVSCSLGRPLNRGGCSISAAWLRSGPPTYSYTPPACQCSPDNEYEPSTLIQGPAHAGAIRFSNYGYRQKARRRVGRVFRHPWPTQRVGTRRLRTGRCSNYNNSGGGSKEEGHAFPPERTPGRAETVRSRLHPMVMQYFKVATNCPRQSQVPP